MTNQDDQEPWLYDYGWWIDSLNFGENNMNAWSPSYYQQPTFSSKNTTKIFIPYKLDGFTTTANNICISSNVQNCSWIQPLSQVYLWPGQFLPPKPIVLDPSDPTRVLSPEELAEEEAKQKAKSVDGQTCKSCNEKNEYATPNQADGTYVCYNCRNKL